MPVYQVKEGKTYGYGIYMVPAGGKVDLTEQEFAHHTDTLELFVEEPEVSEEEEAPAAEGKKAAAKTSSSKKTTK